MSDGGYHEAVRTTLTIDDDVLRAARQLADGTGQSLGEAVSALARVGLQPRPGAERGGVVLLSVRDGARGATLAEVNALRDDEPPASVAPTADA